MFLVKSLRQLRHTHSVMSSRGKSQFSLPSVLPPKERLIWVDCEMTGLDIETDKLLEIAVIVTEGDTLATVGMSSLLSPRLRVVRSAISSLWMFSCFFFSGKTESIIIHCDDRSLDTMGEWCVKQHGASGLTEACRRSDVTCQQAEQLVLHLLEQHTERGRCPLAGNSVGQDRKFIDKHMPGLASWLHYRTVDVSTIKELCRRWYPQVYEAAPRKGGSHRALGDIEESIAELQYYRENVFR